MFNFGDKVLTETGYGIVVSFYPYKIARDEYYTVKYENGIEKEELMLDMKKVG